MPWFRVDDSFYDHPKVYNATDGALALWLRAGTWSARNLTDGRIPTDMARRFGTERAAKELCDRKLWRRTKTGYIFHDWAKYQPTRAKVNADRESAKHRMRLLRQSKKPQVNAEDVRPNFGRSSRPPARPLVTGVSTGTTGQRRDRSETRFQSGNGHGAASRQPLPFAEAQRAALHPDEN